LAHAPTGISQTVSFIAKIGTTGPYLNHDVSAECLPYTHYCMTTASCGPAGTHFTVIGATERTACSAGNTFCTKIRLRRATDRAHARGVIDNQIESQQPRKKKCLLCCEPGGASFISPATSTTNLARGRNWKMAHLRMVHLTNASFSGLRSHEMNEFIMSRPASSVARSMACQRGTVRWVTLRYRVPELNPLRARTASPKNV